MNKVNFLYLFFVVNLIVMIYTIMKIIKNEDYTKVKKAIFLYVSILFPIVGFLLLYADKRK